jgi:hypothetical protein
MDHFGTAERRTAKLCDRLIKRGVPAEIAADSMMTSALGLWAAHTGHANVARAALQLWQRLRVATDHGN